MEAPISSLVCPKSHSEYPSEIGTRSEPWIPSPYCPFLPPWRIILCFLSPLLQEVAFSLCFLLCCPCCCLWLLSLSFWDWPMPVFSILPGRADIQSRPHTMLSPVWGSAVPGSTWMLQKVPSTLSRTALSGARVIGVTFVLASFIFSTLH